MESLIRNKLNYFDATAMGALSLFPKTVARDTTTSIINCFSKDEDFFRRVTSPEHFAWCMDVMMYCLSMPISEMNTIQNCTQVYLHWLSELIYPVSSKSCSLCSLVKTEAKNNFSRICVCNSKLPIFVFNDSMFYCSLMFKHLSGLFVPRASNISSQGNINQSTSHAECCLKVLDFIRAIIVNDTDVCAGEDLFSSPVANNKKSEHTDKSEHEKVAKLNFTGIITFEKLQNVIFRFLSNVSNYTIYPTGVAVNVHEKSNQHTLLIESLIHLNFIMYIKSCSTFFPNSSPEFDSFNLTINATSYHINTIKIWCDYAVVLTRILMDSYNSANNSLIVEYWHKVVFLLNNPSVFSQETSFIANNFDLINEMAHLFPENICEILNDSIFEKNVKLNLTKYFVSSCPSNFSSVVSCFNYIFRCMAHLNDEREMFLHENVFLTDNISFGACANSAVFINDFLSRLLPIQQIHPLPPNLDQLNKNFKRTSCYLLCRNLVTGGSTTAQFVEDVLIENKELPKIKSDTLFPAIDPILNLFHSMIFHLALPSFNKSELHALHDQSLLLLFIYFYENERISMDDHNQHMNTINNYIFSLNQFRLLNLNDSFQSARAVIFKLLIDILVRSGQQFYINQNNKSYTARENCIYSFKTVDSNSLSDNHLLEIFTILFFGLQYSIHRSKIILVTMLATSYQLFLNDVPGVFRLVPSLVLSVYTFFFEDFTDVLGEKEHQNVRISCLKLLSSITTYSFNKNLCFEKLDKNDFYNYESVKSCLRNIFDEADIEELFDASKFNSHSFGINKGVKMIVSVLNKAFEVHDGSVELHLILSNYFNVFDNLSSNNNISHAKLLFTASILNVIKHLQEISKGKNISLHSVLAMLNFLTEVSKFDVRFMVENVVKDLIIWLCNFIKTQASKPPVYQSKDLHTMLVSLFMCLACWVYNHSYFFHKEVRLRQTLLSVLEFAQSGYSEYNQETENTTNSNMVRSMSGFPSSEENSKATTASEQKVMKPISQKVAQIAEVILARFMMFEKSSMPVANDTRFYRVLNLWNNDDKINEKYYYRKLYGKKEVTFEEYLKKHVRCFLFKNTTVITMILDDSLKEDDFIASPLNIVMITRTAYGKCVHNCEMASISQINKESFLRATNSVISGPEQIDEAKQYKSYTDLSEYSHYPEDFDMTSGNYPKINDRYVLNKKEDRLLFDSWKRFAVVEGVANSTNSNSTNSTNNHFKGVYRTKRREEYDVTRLLLTQLNVLNYENEQSGILGKFNNTLEVCEKLNNLDVLPTRVTSVAIMCYVKRNSNDNDENFVKFCDGIGVIKSQATVLQALSLRENHDHSNQQTRSECDSLSEDASSSKVLYYIKRKTKSNHLMLFVDGFKHGSKILKKSESTKKAMDSLQSMGKPEALTNLGLRLQRAKSLFWSSIKMQQGLGVIYMNGFSSFTYFDPTEYIRKKMVDMNISFDVHFLIFIRELQITGNSMACLYVYELQSSLLTEAAGSRNSEVGETMAKRWVPSYNSILPTGLIVKQENLSDLLSEAITTLLRTKNQLQDTLVPSTYLRKQYLSELGKLGLDKELSCFFND